MKVLDLFSGIGGFSLGLERAGMETIAFCEIDKFCQKVLKKHWPNVPIHDDITQLDGKQYAGAIDLVCGGFPCQPFSVAGKQKGKDDNRYLWPEMLRIISEAKPSWFIGENVPGIINLALEQVCADLEAQGYEVQTLIIPACALDAPHRRNRIWIIAYSYRNHESNCTINAEKRMDSNPEHDGCHHTQKQGINAEAICRGQEGEKCTEQSTRVGASSFMADTNCLNSNPGDELAEWQERPNINRCGAESVLGNTEMWREQIEQSGRAETRRFSSTSWWATEPGMGRVVNGLSGRVDRLKSLGNAVVPQIPEILGKYIMEIQGIMQ